MVVIIHSILFGIKSDFVGKRPEQAGQSNLTIAEGVEMWMTYIQPLNSQGLRLGTPASSSAPSGKTWIQDWLSACNGGCTPDFVAIRALICNGTLELGNKGSLTLKCRKRLVRRERNSIPALSRGFPQYLQPANMGYGMGLSGSFTIYMSIPSPSQN